MTIFNIINYILCALYSNVECRKLKKKTSIDFRLPHSQLNIVKSWNTTYNNDKTFIIDHHKLPTLCTFKMFV